LPHVGAVCVYPELAPVVAASLRSAGVLAWDRDDGRGVHVASVATAFPSGQYPLDVRLDDARRAIAAGADEIDMVISRGAFLAGDYERVHDEIAAIKRVCRTTVVGGGEAQPPGAPDGAHLKVILETGELETYDNVRRASDLAIAAGADFIKTSTGKISPAATMPVTLVMLEAVRDHFDRTGGRIGVKPAGGIRTAKQALHYLVMVKETVGDAWLTPRLFRFGASSLANDILMQLARLRTGAYMSPDDFTAA
jgi:deoxyribose-phosphate aldolase